MQINKSLIRILTILSFGFVFILDFVNISQYIDFTSHIDNTISNTITFISILIGFISAIYVMIQQTENSYVLKLLREFDLVSVFNKSIKSFMYVGFLEVLTLIVLNFFSGNLTWFKYMFYIAFPLSVYFLLIANNIITTICKIVISEEKLKNKDAKLDKSSIK